jgi:hypothetical protein
MRHMRHLATVLLSLSTATAVVAWQTTPTVYYVAANQAGASDSACDGLYPSDSGNGHCPFQSFAPVVARGLLEGKANLRVEVRTGRYPLPDGLVISGIGTTSTAALVLRAYRAEPVVLDGMGVTRELVRVSGSYVNIEGLVLRNSGGHNLEVRGSSRVNILNNRFERNGASDSLKGDGWASDVVVRGNTFVGWDSQAIDIAGVRRWTIDKNTFSSSYGANANAIGVKMGSEDITITANTISDTGGINMGGVSSPHTSTFEAKRVTVRGNVITNAEKWAATALSCVDCTFSDNVVTSAAGGILLQGEQSNCSTQCEANRVTVTGNVFSNMNGGVEGPGDVFVAVQGGVVVGGRNTYCESQPGLARFYWGLLLDWQQWLGVTPSDSTSRVGVCQ